MILIGIDQSLKFTGITVRVPSQEPVFYGITHEKHTKWDKLKNKPININIIDYEYSPKSEGSIENERIKYRNISNLLGKISEIFEYYTSKYPEEKFEVRMEGISFGSRQTTAIAELSALNFMIRDLCHAFEIEFTILPPTSVKKMFTGNGQADKELMMESFFRLFPSMRELEKIIKLDDIADSYAMTCWSSD